MLYYSILKYAPIATRSTSIILGVLFHEPSFDHRDFRYIADFTKLKTMCPEIDVKMLEKLLVGIKEQVKTAESFDIEDFTRFYLNDFRFEDIEWEEYGDLDGTIERIVKSYL